MAKLDMKIDLVTHQVTHWGIVKFTKVGDVSLLEFLGFPIYAKVGSIRNVLGINFGS